MIRPLGVVIPGSAAFNEPVAPGVLPVMCRDNATEIARLEWRLDQPGDPADMISGFLSGFGLAGDLSATAKQPLTATSRSVIEHDICGAVLFISAAAGAAMIGAARAAMTPAPAVPDVVAVVYRHAPQDPHGASTPRAGWQVGPWQPSWTRAEHAAAVQQVRAAIAAGDVYQVNVVGHASAEYAGDPLPALRLLGTLPGARYGAVLTGADWTVACASPETLLEVRAGRAVTRPIKGTAPATAAGRSALLASAKERAEHIMIVDLARNDLAQVAVTGSVRVPELFAIRRWCDLWQAESDVVAALRPDVGLAELLRAVCPGGSVTGAPKLAALAQIARLEPVGRGPAMGVLGWVGRDSAGRDTLDLGLTIRTVAADDRRLHLWAGGGITIDSDPRAEVAEAAAKAEPLRRALQTGAR